MWGQPPPFGKLRAGSRPYGGPAVSGRCEVRHQADVILSEAANSRNQPRSRRIRFVPGSILGLKRSSYYRAPPWKSGASAQRRASLAFDCESRSTAVIMRTLPSVASATTSRRIILWALAVMWTVSCVGAQDATYPPHKPSPPKIEQQIFLLTESVVQNQWTQTLSLVNAPHNVTLLNPGQCIRVGIVSTGDNRDDYLEKTKLSFRVEFAGHNSVYPSASPAGFKKIKPEGSDFVSAALSAGGVKMPDAMKTMASLGASADHWCAPVDARDGTATVRAEVESPTGHQILSPSTIQIESFETGSKNAFKDAKEIGAFLQTYYRQANPARLLPALQFVLADQTQHAREGQLEIMAAFLSAAASSDPIAAQDFQTRIAIQPPRIRALGLLILRSAGYDISGVLDKLSADDQQKFLSITPLQDPYDLSPTRDLFQHLDMLWAVFGATGQFKPVKTVAGALSWRSDYEDFDKLRKTPNHSSILTPSIVRGVTYTAAGWSMWSFQRNDPLVADYIDYMLASSDIPDAVKSELMNLSSNPAFKKAGGQ
jgi:hypothetical protein